MLDIRFIVENTQLVKDAMRREIIGVLEAIKADRNKITA